MALALRISASTVTYNWQPLGLGSVFSRHSCRANLRWTRRRWTRGRGLRCSSSDVQESADSVGERSIAVDSEETTDKAATVNNAASKNSSSWLQVDSTTDGFAGWLPGSDRDLDPGKLAGLLKIGAGFVLAVAFAFLTYQAFSRKGIKHAVLYPATQLLQQTKKISGLNADESLDADKTLASESANKAASNDSKEDSHGDKPDPVVANDSDPHQKSAVSAWHSESVEPFGIPAPSTPSAAVQTTEGSLVTSAAVDQEQVQALGVLQALKVIEPGVEPGGLCTRREYARWLIAITGVLARSPAHKVFPATYINSVPDLAFNDVLPEDPDFPYIQGLAEAGLITSNISHHDPEKNSQPTDGSVFLPDSPLSRQDLISWKVALEGLNFDKTVVDLKKLKIQTGYIDMDRIHEDALPFLAADLAAGDKSTIATVFGYTRRLQPAKPVTRAQAAMALITGDAADLVAEELTRLEADDMAEAAVDAELALQSRAQKQVDEYFNTELKLEKDLRLSVEKQVEELKAELESLRKEKEEREDDERVSVRIVEAVMQAERDLLHSFRKDVEEQLRTLTAQEVEVGIEKKRLETLLKEAEEGSQAIAAVKMEVEVEKKALILARLWAEDEAKYARSNAKLHEEARKRWEGQGIEVHVEKDLQEENIPALGWQYSGPKTSLNKFLQRPPVHDLLDKAGNLATRIKARFLQFLEALGRAFAAFKHKSAESFQTVQGKASDSFQNFGEKASDSFQNIGEKASDSFQNIGEKASESFRAVGEKAQSLQQDSVSALSKKSKETQDAARSTAAGLSSSITDGTKKVADGFRGEAKKLAGKFKG